MRIRPRNEKIDLRSNNKINANGRQSQSLDKGYTMVEGMSRKHNQEHSDYFELCMEGPEHL